MGRFTYSHRNRSGHGRRSGVLVDMTTCRVDACERTVDLHVHQLCKMHYQRLLKWGDATHVRNIRNKGRTCLTDGCDEIAYCKQLCITHYQRTKKYGDPQTVHRSGPKKSKYRYLNKQGYITLLLPDGVRVKEHRQVMEQHIGRPLLPTENVHHINGVRDDNRIENLELWVKSQPWGVRAEDEVKRAREVLGLYGHLYPEGRH